MKLGMSRKRTLQNSNTLDSAECFTPTRDSK